MIRESVRTVDAWEVKSYTLRYVDFENPERNVFHAAYEFEVTRGK